MADFAVDPFRRCGFGRGEQKKVTRLAERDFDRRPQVRRRRQAGVVAKYAQRAPAIPRFAELLDGRLQGRRDRLVLGVADKGVVKRHVIGTFPRPFRRLLR
jgi:hypothetical protein